MRSPLLNFRLWLEKNDLAPKGKLAFLTWYLLGLDLLLLAVEKLVGLFRPSYSEYLSGWLGFLTTVVVVLVCVLAARWISSRLLWRLRNRLIVTYIFIGVIPLILFALLAGLAFYLFAGQFAAYVLTSRLESELRSLTTSNQLIADEISSQLQGGRQVNRLRESSSTGTNFATYAWLDGKLILDSSVNNSSVNATLLTFPAYVQQNFAQVVQDNDKFFLRCAAVSFVEGRKLTVVANQPFDRSLLAQLGSDLGEITLFRSAKELIPLYNVGSIPPKRRAPDVTVSFGIYISAVNWVTGKTTSPVPVHGDTRFSTLYDHAFSSIGDLGPTIEFLLGVLLVALAFFEAAAWYIGTRLTRSVTGAVAQLYGATTHVNRGDFSHRIPINSKDQIAALASSFNLMTESIEKLVLEQKEKQRLENEITIAQEVQSQLFPRRISQLPSLEVHGFCRPARSVSGDYYDFLTLGSEKLILAVGDVSGKGISAALLMATIHSAVRAYSVEGIPALRQVQAVGAGPTLVAQHVPVIPGAEVSPGSMLSLLNHQLYHSTPMEKYATLFLAMYDGTERRLTYSNAGHLPPLLLADSGLIRRLDQGGTVVGLFDDLAYDEGSVQLRPGEIFLAYSDGVTEPENDFGEFGEHRLMELVQENRDLPLERISEVVTAAVDDWIGGAEQPDDVTLVLARAR